MTKPTEEQLEAYKAMAKASPCSMEAMIKDNLQRTCDKFKGHEDKFDRCMDYLTECAKEILNSKNGEVDNEVCYRICRDYFNDEIWKKEDEEKAERDAKARKKADEAAAKKAAAEAKKAEAKKKAAEEKKAAAEARKAEALAKKKAEALAKKKAEEERKAAELKKMQEEAAREAEAVKAASKKPEPGQLDFFAIMGV